MLIKNIEEIEIIINEFIIKIDDPFLVEHIYRLKSNWEFHLTENDDFIKTAAAMKTSDEKYRIYFNKNFIKEHIKNKDDLVFVFLHEFLHIVNGDLLRDLEFPWFNKEIANIVFDIKINSCLLKSYLKSGYYFLKRFYNDTENVLNMLLNPIFDFNDLSDNSIFENGEKQKVIIEKIINTKFKNENIIKDKKALAKWYIDAWFKDVPINKLLDDIKKILKIKKIQNIILIGNHGFVNNPEYYEEQQIQLDEFVENDNKKEIIYMVKKALEDEGDRKIIDMVLTTQIGIIPNLGRRETFLLKKGFYPFFFPNFIYDNAEVYKSTHIYIDVSGSFEKELPFIYKLVESVKNSISEPIYIFSDYVEEISINDLKKGIVKTSWGTNFDSVILHSVENKFKKILVITDGIGNIKNFNIAKEKRLEIFVVLTVERSEFRTPWAKIAKKMWVLRKKE